jgi:hypothetical protein
MFRVERPVVRVIQIEGYADWKSAVRMQLALAFDLIDAGHWPLFASKFIALRLLTTSPS